MLGSSDYKAIEGLNTRLTRFRFIVRCSTNANSSTTRHVVLALISWISIGHVKCLLTFANMYLLFGWDAKHRWTINRAANDYCTHLRIFRVISIFQRKFAVYLYLCVLGGRYLIYYFMLANTYLCVKICLFNYSCGKGLQTFPGVCECKFVSVEIRSIHGRQITENDYERL